MSKHKIGLIFNGVWSQYTFAKAEKYKDIVELVYVYDVTDAAVATYDALIIPFQSNQSALAERKQVLFNFLAAGKKIFIEGDCTHNWLDAIWEDRPVNNYWWVKDPNNPPIAHTNFDHPVYAGLKPRHACWHTHGAYTKIPEEAEVIQTTADGEVITWQTTQYGGLLMATTLDPIVEHGIQQITHLDNYTDKLIAFLCGVQPTGAFNFNRADFGITLN